MVKVVDVTDERIRDKKESDLISKAVREICYSWVGIREHITFYRGFSKEITVKTRLYEKAKDHHVPEEAIMSIKPEIYNPKEGRIAISDEKYLELAEIVGKRLERMLDKEFTIETDYSQQKLEQTEKPITGESGRA